MQAQAGPSSRQADPLRAAPRPSSHRRRRADSDAEDSDASSERGPPLQQQTQLRRSKRTRRQPAERMPRGLSVSASPEVAERNGTAARPRRPSSLNPLTNDEVAYFARLTDSVRWGRQIDTTQDLMRLLAAQYYSARGLLAPQTKREDTARKKRGKARAARNGVDPMHPLSVLAVARKSSDSRIQRPLEVEGDGNGDGDSDAADDDHDAYVPSSASSSSSEDSLSQPEEPTPKQPDAKPDRRPQPHPPSTWMQDALDQEALEVIGKYNNQDGSSAVCFCCPTLTRDAPLLSHLL